MYILHFVLNYALCCTYVDLSYSQTLYRNEERRKNIDAFSNIPQRQPIRQISHFKTEPEINTKDSKQKLFAEVLPFPHYLSTQEITIRTNVVEENPSLDVGPLMEITVGIGDKARLPCSIRSQGDRELSKLVLWYKNNTRRPFLSHDNRGSEQIQQRDKLEKHIARISLIKDGLILIIQRSRREDEGEYRCKIHYKKSPSITNRLRLRVIDISQRIRLLDTEERPVGDHVGPFPEEKLLSLLCRANSSEKHLSVEWMVNGGLIASSWTRDSNGLVYSRLQLQLHREHADTLLTCRLTSINNSTDVKKSILDASTTILMNYIPQTTLLIDSAVNEAKGGTHQVTEGMTVTFICIVKSRPPPYNISWLHNGRIIGSGGRRWTKHNSSLVVSPVKKDDTGLYTCLASNSEGDGQSNAINIRVNHAPYCATAEKQRIPAHRDAPVSITCHVEAEPPAVNFTWSFDSPSGAAKHASNAQIYIPNSKNHNGPIEKSKPSVAPTFRTERTDPEKSILLIPIGYDVSNVACFARNSVGRMRIPCTFQLSVFDPPTHLKDCNVSMVSSTQLKVNCIEEYYDQLKNSLSNDVPDLGFVLSPHVKTVVFLEVWDGKSLLMNVTKEKPNWILKGLPSNSDLTLKIYSISKESLSGPLVLHARTKYPLPTVKSGPPTQRDPISESPEESELASGPEEISGFSLFTLLVLLVGGVGAMVFLLSVSIILIRRKGRRRSEQILDTEIIASASNEGTLLDSSSVPCSIAIHLETVT